MSEYRFLNADYFSTAEFHADREEADHINQPGHRGRLMEVARLIEDLNETCSLRSWIDYGSGNGGLLSVVACIEDKRGYDFQPANVEAAQRLGRPVFLKNFVGMDYEPCDLATATEVLEHLQNPHGFLRDVRCKFFIASVPEGETPGSHYEYHLWGWDREGLNKMFSDNGYTILRDEGGGGTLIVVAQKL